jgi:hypothetical protein
VELRVDDPAGTEDRRSRGDDRAGEEKTRFRRPSGEPGVAGPEDRARPKLRPSPVISESASMAAGGVAFAITSPV